MCRFNAAKLIKVAEFIEIKKRNLSEKTSL